MYGNREEIAKCTQLLSVVKIFFRIHTTHKFWEAIFKILLKYSFQDNLSFQITPKIISSCTTGIIVYGTLEERLHGAIKYYLFRFVEVQRHYRSILEYCELFGTHEVRIG